MDAGLKRHLEEMQRRHWELVKSLFHKDAEMELKRAEERLEEVSSSSRP
jgi:hypothetical protein